MLRILRPRAGLALTAHVPIPSIRRASSTLRQFIDTVGQSRLHSNDTSSASEQPRSTTATRKPWTEQELSRLMDLRQQGLTYGDIAEELGRTRGAVATRLNIARVQGQASPSEKLEVRYQPWTKEELQQLDKLRQSGHSARSALAHFPDRTYGSIFNAFYYPRKTPRRDNWIKWSFAEVERLIRLRRDLKLPWQEIVKQLPDRNLAAVQQKYEKVMGLKGRTVSYFTPEEDEELLRLRASGKSFSAIAKELPGRSKYSVWVRYLRLAHAEDQEDAVKKDDG